MSALFTLPSQIPLNAGAILPGAKLHFFQTATTTPQNTYQDDARSTAHANPVVADANGVFAPIYLDPTLPAYRVRLTTAADVQLFQYDGVPSNQNTQQSMRLESTNPNLLLYDTDGSDGFKKYRIIADGASLKMQLVSDNESSFTDLFTAGFGQLNLQAGAQAGDEDIVTVVADTVYTGTYTGFTTSPTESIGYYSITGLVFLIFTGTTATSNATSMTVTGMPASIRPSVARSGLISRVVDSGTNSIGTASIATNGTITFGLGIGGGNFANSGTKGTLPMMVSYLI